MIWLAIICVLIAASITETLKCRGQIDITVVNYNAEVKHVRVEGINQLTAHRVGTPLLMNLPSPTQEDYAGQNYDIIEEHNIQLFPAGKLGVNQLYLYNLTTKKWDIINVYCRPLGVAYLPSRDEIGGFCAVNTSYEGRIQCVPYFTLDLHDDGRWTDTSQAGYCSNSLSTTDLTNPVILQNYNTDYEAGVVNLYFAERGTERLHEINMKLMFIIYQIIMVVCFK